MRPGGTSILVECTVELEMSEASLPHFCQRASSVISDEEVKSEPQKADSFVSLVSTLRERDIESLSITEGEAPEFLFQSPPVEKESLDLAAQESRDFLSF